MNEGSSSRNIVSDPVKIDLENLEDINSFGEKLVEKVAIIEYISL